MFGEVDPDIYNEFIEVYSEDSDLDYETLFNNRVHYLRDLAVENHYKNTEFAMHVAFSCEAELDACWYFCEHFDEIMRNYLA